MLRHRADEGRRGEKVQHCVRPPATRAHQTALKSPKQGGGVKGAGVEGGWRIFSWVRTSAVVTA
jgi:hypothetical protein